MLTKKVLEKIEEVYQKAENVFGCKFRRPTVSYDLRGTTAGKAFLGKNLIKLNYVLLSQNGDTFINQAVPHEIAHLITFHLYGPRVASHGYEWQSVMVRLGQKPERCHNYDVSEIVKNRKEKKKHSYFCACQEHKVSDIIHKRSLAGRKYRCTKCNTHLKQMAPTQSFGARTRLAMNID